MICFAVEKMVPTNSKLLVALIVAISIASDPTPARGDEKADARNHWEEAIRLRGQGDYAGAIRELRMSYELSPEPVVLFALGKAYVTIDKPVEAVDAFEHYLATGKNRIPLQKRVEAQGELRKQRERVGFLDIHVTPAGADVTLDGVELGVTPLTNKVSAAVGPHTVVASLAGYVSSTFAVEVIGGKDKPVELTLQPLPVPKGMLRVECAVPDVHVVANEITVGATPFATPVLLPTGEYRVRMSRAGYADVERLIVIDPERPTSVQCGLKQLAPLPASVKARLRIVGATGDIQTQVDGELTPPGVDLPFGRHTVRVSKPGFRPWERDVDLAVSKTTDLSPEFAPDGNAAKSHPPRAASSERTWAYALGAGGVLLGAGALAVKLWNDGHYVKDRDDATRAVQDYNSKTNALVTQQGRAWTDQELQTESALVSREHDLNGKVVTTNGVAIGLAAGAGALLCSSVIVWLTGSSESAESKVALVPQRSGAGVSWSGAF